MTTLPLDGRVAIVTGGSSGIGRAICRTLAERGAQLVVHYRQATQAADDLVASLKKDELQARAVGADLTAPNGPETLLQAATDAFGAASILVNNAATQPVAAFTQISANATAQMLATNVGAPFRLMQLFARQARANGLADTNIVNIASIEGIRPAANHSHYATAKAALIMATQAAALELGEQGIRVNAVSPGLIDRDGLETDWPEGVARWRDAAPLGRLGKANDVANAVAFLTSHEASWITGHNLVVDGGMSVHAGW